MNMNRLSKQCMVFIAGMISFLYVLGLVGHQDYIEEILYNMPQETYDVIVQKLGNVSRSEIAAEYEHMKGEAADIDTGDRQQNKLLFEHIHKNLPYDQLIDESNFAWVHVSYRADGANRKQVLSL